jgi:hypothetical protein
VQAAAQERRSWRLAQPPLEAVEFSALTLDIAMSAHDLQFEMPTKFTGGLRMPWTMNDAERHTHKATTTALKELWAKVANESLERTGDEGRAIREANAVIARQAEPTALK